jgi:hypothetical protein
VLDGSVLVGRNDEPRGKPADELDAELFVLIRATSGFSLDDAAGTFRSLASTVETRDGGALPQGVNAIGDHLSVTLPETGVATHAGTQVVVTHDEAGFPVATPSDVTLSSAGRFQVKSDGSFTTDFSGAGAFTPDGRLYVRTRFIPTRFGIGFALRTGPASSTGKR